MNKHKLVLASACFCLLFTSCSKKLHTFQFGQPYNHSTVDMAKTEVVKDTLSSAPVQEELILASDNPEVSTALVASSAATALAKPAIVEPIKAKDKPKMSLKEKIAYKMIAKKIQKNLDSQAVTGNLRTGIILGVIGLVLMILGPFTAGILYVIGAIFLVVGLVLILLDLL